MAIGVFDGVHRGHQALLSEARRIAGANGWEPTALTFDPHPSALFAPARVPPLICSLEERRALLRMSGADVVVVAPFDRAFAALTPDEFVEQWLVDRLDARAVVVGEDFRFGCDRSGDIEYLRRAGEKHGFRAVAVPPVFVDGVPCRSTTIRQMLLGGQIEAAGTLLGRQYTMSGEVVHGRKLGRTIGFPTANVRAEPGILVPGAGVYAGEACWSKAVGTHGGEGDGTYNHFRAAISIGTNPTVTPGADALRTVEAYLLDFDGDIYGEEIVLTFRTLLRPTEKFDSLDALVTQMHKDVARAREVVSLPS